MIKYTVKANITILDEDGRIKKFTQDDVISLELEEPRHEGRFSIKWIDY